MQPDLRPMLATLTDQPFDDPDWVFETKWDGFRAIAVARPGHASLYSRNLIDISGKYPTICEALSAIAQEAVLDGELVALDAHGRSRFQLLQNAERERVRLLYCVFDLLYLDGKDLRSLPLLERKQALEAVLPKSPLLLYSAHVVGAGKKAFARAKRAGEEGVMAKLATSRYHSGMRTRDWLKVKASREQEVVIVGFTAPRRSRKYFGALVLAVREGKRWQYVGPRRDRVRRRDAALGPRQARSAHHRDQAGGREGPRRRQHHLGDAQARRRGEVHRMDLGRRDAPPGVPRLEDRQEGDRGDARAAEAARRGQARAAAPAPLSPARESPSLGAVRPGPKAKRDRP